METIRLIKVLLLIVFTTVQYVAAERILFFWGLSGYSHRLTIWPLIERLADRGHNVTFFSSHHPRQPTTHPNITELTPDDLLRNMIVDFDPTEIRLAGGVAATDALWPEYTQMGVRMCQEISKDPMIHNWLNSDSYDLVVINALFNDCGYGIAHKFQTRTMMYSTSSIFPWWSELYGLAEENYPEFQYHLPSKMTFIQQVWNTFTPLYWLMYRRWIYLPKIDSILRTNLNVTDMPSLEEMDQRNALLLINSHYSEEYPRSFPPWVVPVGGMHCTETANPLPDGLQEFVDSWDHGFVYLSFGTYLKLPLLPQAHQDAILVTISKFPSVGFVVKWNGGDPPENHPTNMFPAEWIPQQDLLSHPKIRAFITHGGLLSTQEAIFHAVPLITYPVFAEQDYNAERIQDRERGLRMEISKMTQANLQNAIRTVLTDKKFKRNMEHASRIFRDRSQSPVDTAAWWVEYVLRHKDTSHLKPNGLTKRWYEKRMLHVWAFALLVLSAVLALFGTLVTGIKLVFISVTKTKGPVQKVKTI